MSEITYKDIKVTSFEISLSKLVTKQVMDIRGYLTQELGGVSFKITNIVFDDGSLMDVESEHDFPYIVDYPSYPMANFDEDTLERLHSEQEADDATDDAS